MGAQVVATVIVDGVGVMVKVVVPPNPTVPPNPPEPPNPTAPPSLVIPPAPPTMTVGVCPLVSVAFIEACPPLPLMSSVPTRSVLSHPRTIAQERKADHRMMLRVLVAWGFRLLSSFMTASNRQWGVVPSFIGTL
jgi:hypothetical protein